MFIPHIGTTSPQAALDVATMGTVGSAILVPRDTSANRPTVAVNGMIRYNTTNSKLEGYVKWLVAGFLDGDDGWELSCDQSTESRGEFDDYPTTASAPVHRVDHDRCRLTTSQESIGVRLS